MLQRIKAKVRKSVSLRRKPVFDGMDLNLTEEEILRDLLSFGPVDGSNAERAPEVAA